MCSSQLLLGGAIPTSCITCVLPSRYLAGIFQHQTLHVFFPVATWRGYSNIRHYMCSSQSLLGRAIPSSYITCVLPSRYLVGLFQHQTSHVFFQVATCWAIPMWYIACVFPSCYLAGLFQHHTSHVFLQDFTCQGCSNIIHNMCSSKPPLDRVIPTSYITCVPPSHHLTGLFHQHT